MSILSQILAAKQREVRSLDRGAIEDGLASAPPVRSLAAALREAPAPAVIAEFKRSSPSKGAIRADADPAGVAVEYAKAGAAALSVLTDHDFFGGTLGDLTSARAATALAVLRKDFIIDAVQIAQARAAGADGVLLIVAALSAAQLDELMACASELGVDALVEIHDELDAATALEAGAKLIGINNRDLATFATDPATTSRLLPLVEDALVVSESGLDDPEVIARLAKKGVGGFLIGDALMSATEPGKELQRLRGVS